MGRINITILKERVTAIIIGCIFVASGLLKGFDFISTSLKIKEYSEAFNCFFPNYIYDFAALIIVIAELVIGLFLLFKIHKKVTAVFSIAITIFFLGLTIITVASTNIINCGCFGDFFHISILNTLLKNTILTILTLYNLHNVRTSSERWHKKESLKSACIFLWIIVFCCTNYYNQPLLGSNLLNRDKDFFSSENFGALGIEYENKTFLNKDSLDEATTIYFSKKDTLVVGIINNLENTTNSYTHTFYSHLNEIGNGRETLLLTASIKRLTSKRHYANIKLGICDSKMLSSIIPSNIGIAVLSHGHIIGVWQQNNRATLKLPDRIKDIEYESSYLRLFINIFLWTAFFIFCYNFNYIISWNRKTRKE